MTFSFSLSQEINLTGSGRISPEDAQRQELTAQEILLRLENYPGLVLADEVGMGKTFVALAVAASVALQDKKKRPVVVMIPSNLKKKWPRDFDVFRERCLTGTNLRAASADRPVAFLKLLDDPASRRAHIIFLTHGAMSRNLSDPWVSLAIIHRALYRRHNTLPIRRALARNLQSLLKLKGIEEIVWEELLSTDPSTWLSVLQKHGIDPDNRGDPGSADDPVPAALIEVIQDESASEVFEALRKIPQRQSPYFTEKLRDARRAINQACRRVWKECIKKSRLDLPLLILDEAHHLKNPDTRIASLFKDEDAKADADEFSKGELAESFSRMLFLTATPFQLGHHELCSVLERFRGVNWRGRFAPTMVKEEFTALLRDLANSLDDAQYAAVHFDRAWGKMSTEDLRANGRSFSDVDSWWRALNHSKPDTEVGQAVKNQYELTKEKLKRAEVKLSPWIIRHLKPKVLMIGTHEISRRERYNGGDVLPDRLLKGGKGINIDDNSLLPLLLASRAVALSPQTRPVFSEGLSSSYEAFLDTKRQREEDRDLALADEDQSADNMPIVDSEILWYMSQIEKAVPLGSIEDSISHPKIRGTVERVFDLWRKGEKVVVFCHYIATGRTLRRCISHSIKNWTYQHAAQLLGCSVGDAEEELASLGRQFFQGDGALRKDCDEVITNLIREHPGLSDHAEKLLRIVRRNIRTPSFLVRYFPLSSDLDKTAIKAAFERCDESGLSLRDLIKGFFTFLAERCSEEERSQYIEACLSITPRTMAGADTAKTYGADEIQGDRSDLLMPNVRLANGSTKQETRQRLMLAFNTPFFPEILVASSIMAEGVDLHLNCRHVIHHDLSWNPSTLEQRTGRIDRLGSKMERCGLSIQVYLPYVAETQDEKMFKVVLDREKWFNIVMGEKMETSFAATEKLAERVPLPDLVVKELMFDFGVFVESKNKQVG